MILLSVIIPIYNVEKYIRRCFETLVPQLNNNVEVICIDDGSVDDSYNICCEYAFKYDNFKVFKKTNGGVSSARNAGLKKARGQYIAWVDPDDYLAENWLETIESYLVSEEPDCLIFDYYTDSYGKIIEVHSNLPYKVTKEQFVFSLTVDVNLKSMLWSKVIKREFFEGEHFDETILVSEDYKMLTAIALRLTKIVSIQECLYYYVKRSESLINKRSIRKNIQAAEIARERYELFSSLGFKVSKSSYWKMAILACLNVDYKDEFLLQKQIILYKKMLRHDVINILFNCEIESKVKIAILAKMLLPRIVCTNLWRMLIELKNRK